MNLSVKRFNKIHTARNRPDRAQSMVRPSLCVAVGHAAGKRKREREKRENREETDHTKTVRERDQRGREKERVTTRKSERANR